jgi:hypothetical protein
VSTCPCTFQLLKRFYTILNLLWFLLQHLTVWISLQDMVHIYIGKNTAIIVGHVSYACMWATCSSTSMNEANLAMEMVSVKLQEASNARKKLLLLHFW